jgi:hypothetical protein
MLTKARDASAAAARRRVDARRPLDTIVKAPPIRSGTRACHRTRMDRHDDDPKRPARRDFLASTAATLGALSLPAVTATASAAAAGNEKAGRGNRPN